MKWKRIIILIFTFLLISGIEVHAQQLHGGMAEKTSYESPYNDTQLNDKRFLYTNFEDGSLSLKTGDYSNNLLAVRSYDFIPISQFVSAHISNDYFIWLFLYDKNFEFLEVSDRMNDITAEYVAENMTKGEYCKIVAYNWNKENIVLSNLEDYEFEVFLNQSSIEKSHYNETISLSDFEQYMDDGYLSGHIVTFLEGSGDRKQIVSCSALYESENGSYPTIQFRLVNDRMYSLYYSPIYRLGELDHFENQAWRLPPYNDNYNKLRIEINIPEGVKLKVQKISNTIDSGTAGNDNGVLFHAHQGFMGYCARSTAYAFALAGEMGYKSCITIPKFTSDEVGVCFHDDDSIRALLRYSDGSKIEEGSADDRPVSQFTYEELCQFDAGIKKSIIYAGQQVPTLDTFFEICARYQMAPVLSVHSNKEFKGKAGLKHFEYIRALAEKYGILNQLRIKSANAEVQNNALTVFGHDISGYILLEGLEVLYDPIIRARECGFIAQDANDLSSCDYDLVLEFFRTLAPDEEILSALDKGFGVSIATVYPGVDGPELERLIGLGVTEFTVDHHCSIGLNW